MKDIKGMLTLGRVRGIYQGEDGFSKLSGDDLRALYDYLDLLSDEVYQIKRAVMKELNKLNVTKGPIPVPKVVDIEELPY